MGDEILKYCKNIVAMMIFANFSLLCAESQTDFYDKLFGAIEEQRVGLNQEDLDNIENPFTDAIAPMHVTTPNEDASSKDRYVLEAIINNKAKIDSKWYTVDNKIDNYLITKIDNGNVVLSNDEKEVKLSINRQGSGNVLINFNK